MVGEHPNKDYSVHFSNVDQGTRILTHNHFKTIMVPWFSAEAHGLWSGSSLVPPIGLVGDAVTEPFWIAGVGLQRGWNGVMETRTNE